MPMINRKLTTLPIYFFPIIILFFGSLFLKTTIPSLLSKTDNTSTGTFDKQTYGVHLYATNSNNNLMVKEKIISINPLRRVLECNRLANNPCKASFEKLSILINDRDPIVRAHATSALSGYKSKLSTLLLIKLLKTGNWRSRRCAAEALSKVNSKLATTALQNALNDESSMVRKTARKALT